MRIKVWDEIGNNQDLSLWCTIHQINKHRIIALKHMTVALYGSEIDSPIGHNQLETSYMASARIIRDSLFPIFAFSLIKTFETCYQTQLIFLVHYLLSTWLTNIIFKVLTLRVLDM